MPPSQIGAMLISTEELLAFFRCQRLPYLERYGSPTDKLDPDDLVLQLRGERELLRQQVMDRYPGAVVHARRGNKDPNAWDDAVAETQALMNTQPDRIYRGVIRGHMPGSPEIPIIGTPDVLVRQAFEPKHPHRKGFYLPVEIRTGKRSKPDYEMMLAFHSILLRQHRPVPPTKGLIVVRDGRWTPINLRSRLHQALELMQDFMNMLNSAEMPQVYMARSRCSLCYWRQYCKQLAAATDPLTLLPGVTGGRHPLLQSVGIRSIEDLAASSPQTLQDIPGLGPKVASQLVRQAQSTLKKQAIWIHPLKSTDLRSAPVELYFDIEADPQQDVAYLLGVLDLDYYHQSSIYQSYMAEDPTDEHATWLSFLTLMARYSSAPVYHFHGFEVQSCRKLGEKYGTHSKQINQIINRFIDLRELVLKKVVMPIESYSLKNIARWLGFEWRLSDASGAQSIFWYAQWLETQDPSYLERLKTYNEDDCRATHTLKAWMAQSSSVDR